MHHNTCVLISNSAFIIYWQRDEVTVEEKEAAIAGIPEGYVRWVMDEEGHFWWDKYLFIIFYKKKKKHTAFECLMKKEITENEKLTVANFINRIKGEKGEKVNEEKKKEKRGQGKKNLYINLLEDMIDDDHNSGSYCWF